MCISNSIQLIKSFTTCREGSCDLFPQEMIQEWQERINPRQVLGQVQAELFAEHGQLCPNCGQFNAKVSKDALSYVYKIILSDVHVQKTSFDN